jgi:hypothetical protein
MRVDVEVMLFYAFSMLLNFCLQDVVLLYTVCLTITFKVCGDVDEVQYYSIPVPIPEYTNSERYSEDTFERNLFYENK